MWAGVGWVCLAGLRGARGKGQEEGPTLHLLSPSHHPSRRPRAATVASRQHGCLHPTVSTMGAGANQACRALTAKRACKW